MMGGGDWAGMAQNVDYLKGAVHSGDLYMDQDAANKLKTGMQNLQDKLQNVVMNGRVISQQPPIGDTPKTKVYKKFYATVATDPDQGLLSQVDKMYNDAQDIIDSCVRNMQNTESDAASGLDGVMEI